MSMMPGSKGQKAVHACMIRLLNLGPAKHEKAAPTTKECPYCRSKIHIDAVKCPHCASELPKK